MKKNAHMEYLGSIVGEGTLVQNDKDISRAKYDFEGYQTQYAGITCSGELQASSDVLAAIFGLSDIQLRTDSNRLLEIKFSAKTLGATQDFAHVDVRGQIPGQKREWRRRHKFANLA